MIMVWYSCADLEGSRDCRWRSDSQVLAILHYTFLGCQTTCFAAPDLHTEITTGKVLSPTPCLQSANLFLNWLIEGSRSLASVMYMFCLLNYSS